MEKSIAFECKHIQDRLIKLRREFHKCPEIGSKLPKTVQIVKNVLDEIGISYEMNTGDDGLIADIKGKNKGKTIAFRADMDGLHIVEDTNLPFKSEIDGQMHGCGHDVHIATLLCTAEILNNHREEFNGTVRLIFQTGEETGTGAKQMLAENRIDGVDAICALHVGNLAGDDLEPGTIAVIPGPVSAGKDKFTITVYGKGTHSAFPEKGVDPILIGARIVSGCEEIMARELPAGTAAVLTFGTFQSGVDHNSIPATAVLKGSIRVQDVNIRNFIGKRLECIAKNISNAFGATCSVDIKQGSSTVINDEELSDFVSGTLKEVLEEKQVLTKVSSKLMGSDDFANYAERIPAVYFFLSTNNKEKGICAANHNPKFDVDENVLWKGVASYVAIAMKYLN